MCYRCLSYGAAALFPLQYTPDWVTYIYLTVELFLFCYVMLCQGQSCALGRITCWRITWANPLRGKYWVIGFSVLDSLRDDCLRKWLKQPVSKVAVCSCSYEALKTSKTFPLNASLLHHYSAIIPPLFLLGLEFGHVLATWFGVLWPLNFSMSLTDWPIYAYSSRGRCGNGKVYFLMIVHRV